jgi:hypothetical protein
VPNGIRAAVTYDGARRPIGIDDTGERLASSIYLPHEQSFETAPDEFRRFGRSDPHDDHR